MHLLYIRLNGMIKKVTESAALRKRHESALLAEKMAEKHMFN